MDKRQEKDAKRKQRRDDRDQREGSSEPGVDPDIAGIVPGPQPVQEET
ncbi:MAG TPA: hypothetical protein VNO21_06940 [Polyangiaceae bacterium]|nr:hypothetical protein [Polyangiaceae bacterium]